MSDDGSVRRHCPPLRFLYDMQNEIGCMNEREEIEEFRVLGKGFGAEVGSAVALELRKKIVVPIHDIRGNICCLLDSNTGDVIEYYRYSAFGTQQVFNPEGEKLRRSLLQNPWGYSSKCYDSETGFVYFGRRYYSPSMCRWITPDPKGYDDGPNLYAYVHNNPLTHFDFYGLWDSSRSECDLGCNLCKRKHIKPQKQAETAWLPSRG